jgi:hypothetical protein
LQGLKRDSAPTRHSLVLERAAMGRARSAVGHDFF